MAEFKIKRGYDVPLIGSPERVLEDAPPARVVGLRPTEFRGIRPKVLVKEEEEIARGAPLFRDRERAEIRFVSPGGGVVERIDYGPRRVCREILVRLPEGEEPCVEHRAWSAAEVRLLSREQIVEQLLDSGLWTSLRARPFSLIPEPTAVPEGIFIAASDSSPLPFASWLALEGRQEDFQLGIEVLAKLTEGKVHLCLGSSTPPAPAFTEARGCEKHFFAGPYPSGQIEVQIHHVLPYRKGREVWFLDCQDVASFGEFFRTGRYPVARVVAIGGESAPVRRHFRSRRGVTPEGLLGGRAPSDEAVRYVSGNVLTGARAGPRSCLGHYDFKFSLLPEGKEPEFIGWMLPGFDKISRYRAFASALVAPKRPHVTTALGGGVRAHVATGIYEDVCAVGILPAYLMKSILAKDYEEMEGLGLHDCAECGLCTYVCPSKIEFGEIIAEGIEDFIKEQA